MDGQNASSSEMNGSDGQKAQTVTCQGVTIHMVMSLRTASFFHLNRNIDLALPFRPATAGMGKCLQWSLR